MADVGVPVQAPLREFGWLPLRRLRGWPMVALVLALLLVPTLLVAAVQGRLFGVHEVLSTFDAIQSGLWKRALLCALALGFCWLAGLRVQGRANWNAWLLFQLSIVGIVLLGSMVSLRTAQPMTISTILTVAFGALLVGIFEETVFRGIILNSLAERHGIVLAVFGSSALFGLVHLTNLLAGEPGEEAAFQVTWAFLAGIVFAWTYLFAGRNLILVIVCHAVYDFSLILADGMIHTSADAVGIAMLIIIPIQLAAVITLTIVGVRRSARFTPYKPPSSEESLVTVA